MKRMIKLAAAALLCAAFNTALADKTAGEAVDDSWIHTKVKTTLVGHGGSDINIEVYHGVVQLAGFLTSEHKKQSALDRAASIEGVTAISDQLHVVAGGRSAGRTLDDNVLAGKVKATLADEGMAGVNVEVNRGVVLLSGFVANEDARAKAIEIGESIKGTESVIDGMDLRT